MESLQDFRSYSSHMEMSKHQLGSHTSQVERRADGQFKKPKYTKLPVMRTATIVILI